MSKVRMLPLGPVSVQLRLALRTMAQQRDRDEGTASRPDGCPDTPAASWDGRQPGHTLPAEKAWFRSPWKAGPQDQAF